MRRRSTRKGSSTDDFCLTVCEVGEDALVMPHPSRCRRAYLRERERERERERKKEREREKEREVRERSRKRRASRTH
jgi:hypothetical protein